MTNQQYWRRLFLQTTKSGVSSTCIHWRPTCVLQQRPRWGHYAFNELSNSVNGRETTVPRSSLKGWRSWASITVQLLSSLSWLNMFQLTIDQLLKTLDIHLTMGIKSPDYLVSVLCGTVQHQQLLLGCALHQILAEILWNIIPTKFEMPEYAIILTWSYRCILEKVQT